MSFEDDLQEGMSNFDTKVGEQIEIDATFEELSLAIQNKTGFVLLERTPWRNEIEQFVIKFGSIMLREPSKTKYLMLQHANIKESANIVAVIYQSSTGYPFQIDIGDTVYNCRAPLKILDFA